MEIGLTDGPARQSIWPVKLNENDEGPADVAAAIVPDGWKRSPVSKLLYPDPSGAVNGVPPLA